LITNSGITSSEVEAAWIWYGTWL